MERIIDEQHIDAVFVLSNNRYNVFSFPTGCKQDVANSWIVPVIDYEIRVLTTYAFGRLSVVATCSSARPDRRCSKTRSFRIGASQHCRALVHTLAHL